jgi:hypothetical protein
MTELNFQVQSLVDYRPTNIIDRYTSTIEVKVKWQDFGSEEDSWEPLNTMYEDVENLVNEFFSLK